MAKGKYQEWLEPDGLTRLEAWARDGLTDEQVAKNMGIVSSTLRVWKNKYSAISAALKRGKEVVDIEVENALLKRALGYTYTEEKIEVSKENGRKAVKTVQTVKHIAPDTVAQIFWLKNRKPERWRDKPPEQQDEGNKNNLLQAIEDSTQEDLDTDDLPEIQ